jgi:GTPase SAR1 family protein
MAERSIVICGLPGSGKTTFLAALWHIVFQRENHDSKLKLDSLKDGEHSHLNAIAGRWLRAQEQIHTETSSGKLVTMNLKDGIGRKVRMTFPDLSGESYQQMWEARECDPALASGDPQLRRGRAAVRPRGSDKTTHRRSGSHSADCGVRGTAEADHIGEVASEGRSHGSPARRTTPTVPLQRPPRAGEAGRDLAVGVGQG